MLANNDVLKIDEVLKMNAHKFMYWAEYLIKKNKIENTQNKLK